MKKIILSIDGMTCSACSNGLEKYLNKQNGIKQASVNLVMANANIEYDEKILNIQKLEEFVKQAGFKMAFAEGGRKAKVGDNVYLIPRYALNNQVSLNTFKYYVN